MARKLLGKLREARDTVARHPRASHTGSQSWTTQQYSVRR
jgi:hypothetical protein